MPAPFFVRCWVVVGLLLPLSFASAQTHAKHKPRAALPAPVHATGDVGELPPAALNALQRAKVPADALHVMLWEAGSTAAPRLSHQAQTPVNPASLMKLVTTSAALDSLGAAFTWHTPVYVDGPIKDGVLQGSVYLKGSGDPQLVVERLWLLMRRLQGLGIQKIQGDLVIDRSAFDVAPRDEASFDGEPLRPYNAAPDALLVNFKSLLVHFSPDRAANVAHVHLEPPMSGVQFPATVALSNSDCTDYRSSLKADWTQPTRISFAGSFPASCGDKIWPIAYSASGQFLNRALLGMWQQLGGQISGQVREGLVPSNSKPVFDVESAPLSDIVRSINKYSNNVMAQQVFLSLSQQQNGVGSFAASNKVVQQWWRERVGSEPPVLDNGSGLSRDERISASGLAQLLQTMWRSPNMSELMSSLPVTGTDGTLKRNKAQAVAHLKTGSLRDVAGIAGYVDGANAKRWILVAVLNHPNANAARPALDALIDWAAQQP